MFIDLHTHSTFSDGLLSPSELIAASKQIEDKYPVILAMTDHDTLLGLPEFLKEAKHQGIMGISGLELSVNYEHPVNRREENVHILCYGIDRGSGEFKRFLGNLVKMRKLRCETIVKKFNALNLNVKLSIDDVFEKVSVSCGRPHVAMLLMEKGVVKSIEEAFERFLDIGRPCYVPKQTWTLEETAKRIKKFCQMTSIAHPARFWPPKVEGMPRAFSDVVNLGFDAIEAYHYSTRDGETRDWFLRQAEEYDLYVTGGSDYHGEKIRPVRLGEISLPEEYFEPYKSKLLNG